jgi:large subunit ribosomal protein L29
MKAAEIRGKSQDELAEYLQDLRREQFNLRFQQATGQLEKPSTIRAARREIARIKTVLAERRVEVIRPRVTSQRLKQPINKAGGVVEFTAKMGLRIRQPAVLPQVKRKELPSSSQQVEVQLLRDLQADDVNLRIAAMAKLKRTALHPAVADYGVAKLVPQLFSSNRSAALDAAVTICALTYPDRYAGISDAETLSRVKEDLPKALHDRRCDFATFVTAQKISGDKVRVHARLTKELPLTEDGQSATLKMPKWIENANDLHVQVSGRGVDLESVKFSQGRKEKGDVGSVVVECKVSDKSPHNLYVDFVVADRHLKRDRVSY